MPKPHHLFSVWSPDAVGECLKGVPPELYTKLWNLTEELPQDTSEVPDNFEIRATVKVWDKLTKDEQLLLNQLAEAQDRE